MRERAKSAKRILKVQTLLHDGRSLQYLKAKQHVDALRADEVNSSMRLSSESALHGLLRTLL